MIGSEARLVAREPLQNAAFIRDKCYRKWGHIGCKVYVQALILPLRCRGKSEKVIGSEVKLVAT